MNKRLCLSWFLVILVLFCLSKSAFFENNQTLYVVVVSSITHYLISVTRLWHCFLNEFNTVHNFHVYLTVILQLFYISFVYVVVVGGEHGFYITLWLILNLCCFFNH